MIDIFEQAMQRNWTDGTIPRSRDCKTCVGGMVLARSIEDRVLADEIREAAMSIALSLGQWSRAERSAATERRHFLDMSRSRLLECEVRERGLRRVTPLTL